jgi:hypothetical protein
MYSLSSRKIVPLHVLCGEFQEILCEGTRFCVIAGDSSRAEIVVEALNRGIHLEVQIRELRSIVARR